MELIDQVQLKELVWLQEFAILCYCHVLLLALLINYHINITAHSNEDYHIIHEDSLDESTWNLWTNFI